MSFSVQLPNAPDAHELGQVAEMLATRPDITEELITHRFGIDDAERAFEIAAAGSAQGTYFRVVVHP